VDLLIHQKKGCLQIRMRAKRQRGMGLAAALSFISLMKFNL
jgi:hypothetical protein